MMAAMTRSQKRAGGELPEDLAKNPTTLQKELAKIYPKNKPKKLEAVRQGSALEQKKKPDAVSEKVDELPFAEVQPLPVVTRASQKNDLVGKLLAIPKMTVEPGFKNKAPLEKEGKAKELVQEALKNPIQITTEDLLSVSEPVRREFKRLLAKKRVENKTVTFAAEVDSVDEEDASGQTHVGTISVEKLPEATYEVLAEDTNGMAKGSVIVNDPVMQYLSTLGPGEQAKSVIVAAESNALRTVYPLINRTGEVESLLDPGSQIVSMAKSVAVLLEVSWDPDITVQMQSANNTLEQTLGLAKNVPFLFGTITVYLQVHVIGNAAYKVLLGRPFDIVTESIVKNAKDGSQSLTLTDPNTGVRCVMHTHERGKVPTVLQRSYKSDFQLHSMN
jgi:hypothetical protein